MSSAMKKTGGSTLKPRLSASFQNIDDVSDQDGLLGEAKDVPRTTDGKAHMRRGSRNGGSTNLGSTQPQALSRQLFVLSYLQLCVVLVLVIVFGCFYYLYSGFVPKSSTVETSRTLPTPEILTHHCREHIGPPRVEKVTDSIFVAIGYDLANTILIKTSAGHVVVDVAMSPVKSRLMKAALFEKAGPAPIHSIIYTHSHIDHVGGATGWAEPETKIWATDALAAHFFKQYGVFRKTEMLRGARQYGADVSVSELPCSALGARVDLKALAGEAGFLMPTDTFSGKTKFQVGEDEFELVEAHGETHDQLFVWLPKHKAMLPGDNYYQAFPNLYTIRGTTPRPVREWIRSLDEMRALVPEYMVPSHTAPVIGTEAVQKQLTDYRDAIAWIFAETIRGANEGRPVDELASSIGLPPHLRENNALDELYGQVDWSVRAIYSNELGWFDGEAENLYPMALDDEAHRMLQLMGGVERVMGVIKDAQKAEDHAWALRLIKLLRTAAPKDPSVVVKRLNSLEALSLSSLGKTIFNTNGRAYLLQAAAERSGTLKGRAEEKPSLSDALIDAIPIDLFFEVMATRLRPELSIESHESALFKIGPHSYIVTIRKGVAEIIKGDKPLYGTPDLIGTLIADEKTFRRLGLSQLSPASAIMSGSIKVEGDQARFLQFFLKFERGA